MSLEGMIITQSAIAIDGPGAVGKTTVGRLLAQRLCYLFVDTGNMYRAITCLAIEQGIDANDGKAMEHLAWEASIKFITSTDENDNGAERVMVAGRDLSEDIKQPEIDRQVSLVARHPGVRAGMVSQQRSLAARGKVVMAGRDIGTVVLPDARLKIYLTASVEERARRRHLELQELEYKAEYPSILRDLKKRDKIDSERKASPLRPAKDARRINTDALTPEEVVERILQLWRQANPLP